MIFTVYQDLPNQPRKIVNHADAKDEESAIDQTVSRLSLPRETLIAFEGLRTT